MGRATAGEGLGGITLPLGVCSTGVLTPPAELFLLLGGVFMSLAEPLPLGTLALLSAAACLECRAAASAQAALSAAEDSSTGCCAADAQLSSAAAACFSSRSLKLAAAGRVLRGVSVLS